jgi:hypothetical protein
VANPIAEAIVEVRPDSSKFTKELNDQLKPALDKAEKQIEDSAKGASSSVDTVGKAATKAAIPAGLAIAGLGAFLTKSAKDAEDARIASERLGSVLTSMGYPEAQSRVESYADKLEQQVAVDGEVIKATQAKLATFANLTATINESGGAFDRATQASLDLAAAGFGSAESNAVQLGKALQDPIKGVGALARAGVTFTEEEKAKIKTLVESNQMLEAQNLVLGAIEKQVGGTAEATASDFAKMQISMENMREELGAALAPILEKVVGIITRFASWVSRNTTLVLVLAAAIGTLATAIIAISTAYKIYTAYQKLSEMWAKRQAAANIALNASFLANPIVLVVAGIVALIAAIVLAYNKVEWFRNAVNAAFDAIKTAIGAVVDFFVALWDFAFGLVRGYLDTLFKFWGAVFDGIAKVVRFYVSIWLGIFQTLWNGIKTGFTAIKDFVSTIFGAISGIVKGVVNGIITIVENGVNFAIRPLNALINGINRIPGINIPNIPELKIPRLADGAIIGGPTTALIGEAGPEAVIPLTRPARAMQLLNQSGLASLARNGAGGNAVNIENATFVAPIDADLLAQKVLVAERARSFG